jgi:hypothetical protein
MNTDFTCQGQLNWDSNEYITKIVKKIHETIYPSRKYTNKLIRGKK